MVKSEIISEEPITMAELKTIIEKIKKRDKELNIRASRTEEYLNEFTILNEKEAKKLYEEIKKLDIKRLKDKHICKIVDLLPRKPEELKAILQGQDISLTNEDLKKITNVVDKYVK